MALIDDWKESITDLDEQGIESFQNTYYPKEQKVYEDILEQKDCVISGTLEELAKRYEFDIVMFAGFMEGINDSLQKPYDLEKLKAKTKIELAVDHKKLYYNMLEAKASWLYGLKQWDAVLSEEKRRAITKEHRMSKQAISSKVDRNSPCPCGSGKKFKKCCGANK